MPAAPTFGELFDPEFLAALRPFALRARRVPMAGRPADQTSRQRGAGVSSRTTRAYTPGDDLRTLDWNIYRRLGRLFVRVFEERRDLPVYLLVDRSRSMYLETLRASRRGSRPRWRWPQSRWRSMTACDCCTSRTTCAWMSRRRPARGGCPVWPGRMASLTEQAGTDLVGAARELAGRRLRHGLLVVVSDFFDPAGVGRRDRGAGAQAVTGCCSSA